MVITYRAMRLDEEQVQDVLEAYKGPRNEIEKEMMVSISVMFMSQGIMYMLYCECRSQILA